MNTEGIEIAKRFGLDVAQKHGFKFHGYSSIHAVYTRGKINLDISAPDGKLEAVVFFVENVSGEVEVNAVRGVALDDVNLQAAIDEIERRMVGRDVYPK